MLILCAVFHVVQSNPDNAQSENRKKAKVEYSKMSLPTVSDKTVSREWNSPDSAQIKNGIHKRGKWGILDKLQKRKIR